MQDRIDKIAQFVKGAKIKGDIERHNVVLKSSTSQNQFTYQEITHFLSSTIEEMRSVSEGVLKDLAPLGEFTTDKPLVMVTKFGLMVVYNLRSSTGISKDNINGIMEVLKKHKLL